MAEDPPDAPLRRTVLRVRLVRHGRPLDDAQRGGEVWHDLPKNPGGLSQKTFWWSANWPHRTELEPDITVTGRRLDGPGRFEAGHPGTNASADFGIAMLAGIDVPATGCWRLTAEFGAPSSVMSSSSRIDLSTGPPIAGR